MNLPKGFSLIHVSDDGSRIKFVEIDPDVATVVDPTQAWLRFIWPALVRLLQMVRDE